MKISLTGLPTWISMGRVACVPLMLVAAHAGSPGAVVGVLCIAFVSDLADGAAARRLGCAGPAGARIDTLADLAVYVSLLPTLWMLRPDVLLHEWGYVSAAVLGFTLPVLVGVARYRRIPSHHTWSAKTAVVATAMALLFLIWRGWPAPFRFATVLIVAAGIENVAVTAVLPHWTADVPSLAHAWRIRRARQAPGDESGGDDGGVSPLPHGDRPNS